MDFLVAEIERKKKEAEAAKRIVNNGSPSGDVKYLKRGELEKARVQQYFEDEERERAKKRLKTTTTAPLNENGKASLNNRVQGPNASASSVPVVAEEKLVELSETEIKSRLRSRNHPVTLFGESVDDRIIRLQKIIAQEHRAKPVTFKNLLEATEQNLEERQYKGTDQEEDPATKAVKDQILDVDTRGISIILVKNDLETARTLMSAYFKKIMKLWEIHLEERQDEIKRTPKGKLESITFAQTGEHLKPFYKGLKKRALALDILSHVAQICEHMQNGNYLKANDEYIRLAIGNSPWPIGVTNSGIHERAADDRIKTGSVAHVLNDETSRKNEVPKIKDALMDFITSTISKALGSQGPTLLFTIGQLVEDKPQGSIWSIYSGVKKDDQQPVSVFIFDIKKSPERVELARNALKRSKTLRYPDCIRFIDGIETEQQIIIGTEQVESLQSNLFSNLDENLARLGLMKVASTLKFLSEDCQMIHGNIGINSVFVTRSGEWKLGGFEVMYSLKEERSFLKTYGYLLPKENRLTSPELDMDRVIPTTAIDAWSFGFLIYNVFNGINVTARSSLENRGQIPIALFRHYKSLLNNDPGARLSIEKFLKFTSALKGYFDDDFINTSLFLEQLALKDKSEKEQFLVNIEKSVGSFPINFCKFKILPELVQSLEFGGAGAKALKPILTIGSRLGSKEFEQLVTPAIIKLFNSNDRSIRLALCEKIDSYVNQLSDQACNDTIYPNLATGFSDSTPIIREQTLRAVSIIAPKLQKKTINNSLLRYLAKLQVDQEPGIRTNTTICLAKLSKYFDESLKGKVLLQAFLRSLHDPFPFARKAGLMGIVATSESFAVDDVARKFIPHVAPLLIDPESSIREQAFTTIESLLKIVKKHSAGMPSPVAQNSSPSERVANTGGEAAKEGSDGWTSWAISAVSTGIASNRASTTAPPQEHIKASLPPSSASSIDSVSASFTNGTSLKPRDLPAPKGLVIPPKTSNWVDEASGWNDDFADNKVDASKKVTDSWNAEHGSFSSWTSNPVPKSTAAPQMSKPSISASFAPRHASNHTSATFGINQQPSGTNSNEGWGVEDNENGWGDDNWDDAAPVTSPGGKSERELERERRQKERELRRQQKR